MPVISTMTKAAAPITGGTNCPVVEAAVSTPPADSGRKPTRFMSGIVNVPVVATLAVDEPENEPIMALARTADFAGPPL